MKIFFTGGGSAGHVTPNIALIDYLKHSSSSLKIHYMGSKNGIEKNLTQSKGLQYHAIVTGKWRRYRSWRNLLTPIQVLIGIAQATWIIWREKPQLIFSKGGFVSFPAVVAGHLLQIPIFCHESDLTPGLANRLSYPFVSKILLTFSETKVLERFQHKTLHTGTPIRESLFLGEKAKGLNLCGFDNKKPCILVMGGSAGARHINSCIRHNIDNLTDQFYVIHICGKGNIDRKMAEKSGYQQFEYVDKHLPDLIACTRAVVSRAGANSIAEWLALKIPHLLIPLSSTASRGDQIANATFFANKGTALLCDEKDLNTQTLLDAIQKLLNSSEMFITKMDSDEHTNGTAKIAKLILTELEQ